MESCTLKSEGTWRSPAADNFGHNGLCNVGPNGRCNIGLDSPQNIGPDSRCNICHNSLCNIGHNSPHNIGPDGPCNLPPKVPNPPALTPTRPTLPGLWVPISFPMWTSHVNQNICRWPVCPKWGRIPHSLGLAGLRCENLGLKTVLAVWVTFFRKKDRQHCLGTSLSENLGVSRRFLKYKPLKIQTQHTKTLLFVVSGPMESSWDQPQPHPISTSGG